MLKNYEIGKTLFWKFIILSLLILFDRVLELLQVVVPRCVLFPVFVISKGNHQLDSVLARIRKLFCAHVLQHARRSWKKPYWYDEIGKVRLKVLLYCKWSCLKRVTGIYRLSRYGSQLFSISIKDVRLWHQGQKCD